MTESFWQHRFWSGPVGDFVDPAPIVIQLDGIWTLKKLLLHDSFISGNANYPGGGNYPTNLHTRYIVNWHPAGGDSREIFRARYRVPSQFITYKPAGGATDGWYVVYSAGDHEVGFNQKYSYPQFDEFAVGSVEFNFRMQKSGLQSLPFDVWWEGMFSVLAQRP